MTQKLLSKQQIEIKIQDYERSLDSLRRIMFEDDADWKGEVEKVIKLLVEDKIEILKRRKELIAEDDKDSSDAVFTGTVCPICLCLQFTCPSGIVCENGHGF